MSATKNKPFDLQGREQPAVRRFITGEPDGDLPELFNAAEEIVRDEVRVTMGNMNVCRCAVCYHDVCALTLNNISPQYVTSHQGALLKKAGSLLSISELAKISSEIFKAIEQVKNNPGH